MNNEQAISIKLQDYNRALALVQAGVYDDLHFLLLLFEYERLAPEERLALGINRGRRKYFLVRK